MPLDCNGPTTLLYALRKAMSTFFRLPCWPSSRYIILPCYRPEALQSTFYHPILHSERYFESLSITSDSSAGHYIKPPNFGLVDSQIFWEELPASWNTAGCSGTSKYLPLSNLNLNLAHLGISSTCRTLIHCITLILGFHIGRNQIFLTLCMPHIYTTTV